MSTAIAKPRGLVSTIAVTLFLSAFGGLLWIGRTRRAFAFIAVVWVLLFGAVAAILSGILPSSRISPNWLQNADLIVTLAINVASLALVLPLRKRSQPQRWHSAIWGVLLLFFGLYVATSLLAGGLRVFVLQTFSVPAGSMRPSLVEGDYFYVSKFAYGWGPYSAPGGLMAVKERLFPAVPLRGDIVVFRHPEQAADFVKRVIGLPGDSVQMVGGVLHLNDRPVEMETVGTTQFVDAGNRIVTVQRETLSSGASYTIYNIMDGSVGDDTQVFVVPAAHFFVLGDNRDNSLDSRFNVGFVPFENLIGRAERIFWNSEGVVYSDRANLRPDRPE